MKIESGRWEARTCELCGMQTAVLVSGESSGTFIHECGKGVRWEFDALGKGLEPEVIRAQQLQQGLTNAALDAIDPPLSMWVIYDKPRDYPTSYVVRRFAITRKGSYGTNDYSLHATLEEARAAVPEYTVRLERDPKDEPQIVECWI